MKVGTNGYECRPRGDQVLLTLFPSGESVQWTWPDVVSAPLIDPKLVQCTVAEAIVRWLVLCSIDTSESIWT